LKVVSSIPQTKLESLLFGVSRCAFISFTAITTPDMRRTGNKYADTARKVTIGRGEICWRYSSAVNRQRARENSDRPKRALTRFVAQARKWGSRLKGTPLVSYTSPTDKTRLLYLEIKVEARTEHYFDSKTRKRIPATKINPFLKSASAQPQQGVNREIVLRDYRLDHLAELTLNGTRYTIAPAAADLLKFFPAPKPTRAKAPAKAPVQRRPRPKTKRSARGAK